MQNPLSSLARLCAGWTTEIVSNDETIIGRLTILPRLNSLNQDPGISLGQEDILTCGQQKWTRHLTADIVIIFF